MIYILIYYLIASIVVILSYEKRYHNGKTLKIKWYTLLHSIVASPLTLLIILFRLLMVIIAIVFYGIVFCLSFIGWWDIKLAKLEAGAFLKLLGD